MAELPSLASQDRYPLVNYVKRNSWGNPQLNRQFQVRLARVSHKLGYTKNFVYMGKYYLLPEETRFYNVFTLGGLDAEFYGLDTRNGSWAPFNRWINVKEWIEKRGIIFDFYNEKGLMYNRCSTWIMQCFNGTTLVAFVKNDTTYPMPIDKPMYMRCYTPDVPRYNATGYTDEKAKLEVEGIIYYDFRDWDKINSAYKDFLSRDYGKITTYHNGVIKPYENISPSVGDMIEIFLDPTIEKTITYRYSTLLNYYSTRDKKSKAILFPWFDNPNKRYYYFDDCEFYVYNRRTQMGIYLHRNNQDCIRQLTHQDYGVAGDYLETVSDYLIDSDKTNLSQLSDIDILVTYHRTTWIFYLWASHSRIADLYLLEDPELILNAMTGPQSNVVEWRAPNLEDGAYNRMLGTEYLDITNEQVFEALGYNGCANVLSNVLFYMPGVMPDDDGYEGLYETPPYTGKGYLVPPTYRVSSTVYEYDKDGLFIGIHGIKFDEYYIPSKECVFAEYALGPATTWLDAVLTKKSIKVNEDYGFRVYRAPWAIGDGGSSEEEMDAFWQNEWSVSKDGQPLKQTDTVVYLDTADPNTSPDTSRYWDGGEIAGDWEDITDTDMYTFNKDTGYIDWNINMNNYVGMVVSDSKHLYFQVDVEHLDHSLSFSLIHMWEIGGILLPIKPGQVDIWMEGHPLIENVDYIFDFPLITIVNKQHLVEGQTKYRFTARAVGLHPDGPLKRSELGFVTNGVIGYNGRYNLRINRPTKTVIDGRIFLTQAVDWAENKGHGDNLNGLEGFPYEVKHYLCLNKYVEKYNTQKGLDDEVDLDYRISSYLTEYVKHKTNTPPVPLVQFDRYRVFSPFMSQLYNELRLGFTVIPDGDITDQIVYNITENMRPLLKYDPCVIPFNEAYFEVHPCSNVGYQPITPRQLIVLEKANSLFLNNRIRLRGHFEVSNE